MARNPNCRRRRLPRECKLADSATELGAEPNPPETVVAPIRSGFPCQLRMEIGR